MQINKIQVDNLTVESFPTGGTQPITTAADEPNFMVGECTGCMSGCGIIAY
jgi:hypothetical protein